MSDHISSLEARRLFAATATLTGTTLTITGTDSADAITVSKTSSSATTLSVKLSSSVTKTFTSSKVKLISVDLKGGSDTFKSTDVVTQPMKILGGAGSDSIQSGGGKDTVQGQSGNDTLVAGGGDDSFSGGTDTDLVDYSKYTSAVNVTLDNDANDGKSGEHDNVLNDVENINGGSGSDDLEGDSATNVIHGNGGNDTITGNYAWESFDPRDGGPIGLKADSLYGDSGNDDILITGDGSYGFGGDGNDKLDDNSQHDVDFKGYLYGDAGKDTIYARRGYAIGGDDADTIYGYSSATVSGQGGDDKIYGGATIDGGSGNDKIQLQTAAYVTINDGQADIVYTSQAIYDGSTIIHDKYDNLSITK